MISQNKQKGFTIVELLIVIVVIAILAAISIVAYNGVTQKSRDSQRASDARNIVNGAASYQAEKGEWPTIDQLKSFNTVKLTGEAASRLKNTGTVSSTTKDSLYLWTACMSSDTTPVQTGVRLEYYQEASPAGVKNLTAGTCS